MCSGRVAAVQGLQEQVQSMRCEIGELKQMLREALGRSSNGVSHPPVLGPHGAASRNQPWGNLAGAAWHFLDCHGSYLA